MMPKSPKLASFPRVARPVKVRPMAHRVGGRTYDLYLSVQLGFWSRLPMGLEKWGRQLTTRKGEIGVPKWGHFGCLK